MIRKWAHAPWHSWIKESKDWVEIFAELWARIPAPAAQRLLGSSKTLIFLPPVSVARVVRIDKAMLFGAQIVQLDEGLLKRPRDEALAVLAHELAHLCVPAPTSASADDELKTELAADRLAMEWGFKSGLVRALQKDLDGEHPRVQAALAA